MGAPRRLLFRSAIWEIARPRAPLTLGHVLVRLTDPSVAFTRDSAADWLYCYRTARAGLSAVLSGKRCALMFAVGWHPLGDAVGEPSAETSSPTFHLFARWTGETTTPAEQLLLPARHRHPAPQGQVDEVDAALRASLPLRASLVAASARIPRRLDAGQGGTGAAPWAVRSPGVGHRLLVPGRSVRSVEELEPDELLAAAGLLQPGTPARTAAPGTSGDRHVPASGSHVAASGSGFSCVAAEAAPGPRSHDRATRGTLELHVMKRSLAEAANPLEVLLRSSEVSHALL